jgi:hypothetical protein
MMYVVCCMMYDVCCMMYVVCCMLFEYNLEFSILIH